MTLWLKSLGVAGARYVAVKDVDSMQTVDDFISRWVSEEKLDVRPSLVTLRLVRCAGDEPTAEEEAAAILLSPRRTLREAGIADGSSLLACVSVPSSSRAGSEGGSSPEASSALALALGSLTARLCNAANLMQRQVASARWSPCWLPRWLPRRSRQKLRACCGACACTFLNRLGWQSSMEMCSWRLTSSSVQRRCRRPPHARRWLPMAIT